MRCWSRFWGLDGEILASDTFTMQPLAPVLFPVGDLGAGDFDNGVLRFTMLEGAGIFGASKVDGVKATIRRPLRVTGSVKATTRAISNSPRVS